MDSVVVNRIGRANDAIKTIRQFKASKPVHFPKLREFREFALEPGFRHNFHAPKYLGDLLRHEIKQVLIIDPHALHRPSQAEAQRKFLEALRTTPSSSARLQTSQVRFHDKQGDFKTQNEQRAAAQKLVESLKNLNVKVEFPTNGFFVDHDRLIYLNIVDKGSDRYFKIILGQGLFGFEQACRKRSHVVWFEIQADEWMSVNG